MKFAAITSAAALALALGWSAPAVAQDAGMEMTINGQVVSESDLPFVKERCDDLKNMAEGSLLEETDQGTDDDMDSEDDEDESGGMADDMTTIQLDTITMEQCEEGGFYADSM